MSQGVVQEKDILEGLRVVIDPELGCNVVDLGLIYETKIDGNKVIVKMTLTSAGCPMQASMAAGVQMALLAIEGVTEADVQLVWDPPWTPARLSEYGRACLGIDEADLR